MKRTFVLLLSLLMLLSFCGCMQGGLQASDTTIPTETTVPSSTREAEIQLEYSLEGMVELQDATLYVGNGYSIYIPNDDWLVTEQDDGSVSWRSRYNSNVTLDVIPSAGETFDQAKGRLFAGYTGLEVDGEYVYGYDEVNQVYLAARFIETPNGILAAIWNYDLESAEGFGARLRVIAATVMMEEN